MMKYVHRPFAFAVLTGFYLTSIAHSQYGNRWRRTLS